MKIFITGASGFIGSHLLQKLLDDGHTVNALYRSIPAGNLPRNLHCFKGDIMDADSIAKAMTDCDIVYHTAALAKLWSKNKEEFYSINVQGTVNVLEAAVNCGIRKLVFTSSCGVLGPSLHKPMTENDPRIISFRLDYERSKHMAEIACREYAARGLNVVIVNPTRVYGSSNNTVNGIDKMIQQYMCGKWYFIPGNGKTIGNYAYVNDVVNGHILAMQKGNSGERYILGGENLDYLQLFDKIRTVTGAQYRLLKCPITLVKIIGYLQLINHTISGTPPTLTPSMADRLRYDAIMSCEKSCKQLGYTITPFETALAESLHIKSIHTKISNSELKTNMAV